MGDSPHFISSAELARRLSDGPPPRLIDVRKAPAFAAAQDVIVTAAWRNPEDVTDWWQELSADEDVVVYCVHGHEVSQGVTGFLRGRGLSARYLEGGFEGFVEAGGATSPKPGPGDE